MNLHFDNLNEYKYEQIAAEFTKQILTGVLIVNDKLPSIRNICSLYDVSISTALQAYALLEGKGLIHAIPQSGYYVSYLSKPSLLPNQSNPTIDMGSEDASDLVNKVYNDINSNQVMLSLGVPAQGLLPLKKLNRVLTHTLKALPDHGSGYEHILGSTKLRRQVARLSYSWGGQLNEDEVLTVSGCTSAMTNCLIALTQRGDTIVVESPVYFGILQLASGLGLNVLELPSHPKTGIELMALKKTLQTKKVKLCILISNFSNPMGGTMPVEHKKEVVRLIEHYHIPLIENDMYGDLYFGEARPINCKAYDETGLVLLCSSVSKTLAPGYRVGWVAPGKFMEQIKRVKFFNTLSANKLSQETIASFLENGRYEQHLKMLRRVLHGNSLRYMEAIHQYFPEDARVSSPQGGFMLWVELNSKVNMADLYHKAIKYHISIAPGRMFTLQNQFNNCMRLSYGLPYTETIDRAIKTIGTLIK